jgi:hypothetical protein
MDWQERGCKIPIFKGDRTLLFDGGNFWTLSTKSVGARFLMELLVF